jgi:hypothetical protein
LTKLEYTEFCKLETTLPIFMQNWWLDAVCLEGLSWRPLVFWGKENQPHAVLIVFEKQQWPFSFCYEPRLTPYSGIWFNPLIINTLDSEYARNSFIKNALSFFAKALPNNTYTSVRFSPNVSDWQPFSWAGFKQTTGYTYQVNLENPMLEIEKNFNESTARNAKKARKIYTQPAFPEPNPETIATFIALHEASLKRQEFTQFTPKIYWDNIFKAAKNERAIQIISARNDAMICIVWDNSTAYYLAGGSNDIGRKNGAMHFLLAEALRFAQEKNCKFFDFEGSMHSGIEVFFRSFGGTLLPCLRIFKYKNLATELLLRSLKKGG